MEIYIATREGLYDHGVVMWDTTLDGLKSRLRAWNKTKDEDDYHSFRVSVLKEGTGAMDIGEYLKLNLTAARPILVGHIGSYPKGIGNWGFRMFDTPEIFDMDET